MIAAEKMAKHIAKSLAKSSKRATDHLLNLRRKQLQRVTNVALLFGRVSLILRTKPTRLQRQRRRANA